MTAQCYFSVPVFKLFWLCSRAISCCIVGSDNFLPREFSWDTVDVGVVDVV